MLETVYLGLSQLPKLSSLTIRFPSSRHPRPTTVIPPMPHLQSLKITDIDPLCYPDDISTLLLRSRKIRVLKMHWSPRMKQAQEPSVTLHDYFRKCIAAKSPLRLRKIALQNMYALHTDEFETAMDRTTIREVTMINSPGVEDDGSMASFVDNSWTIKAQESGLQLKTIVQDRVSTRHCAFLESVNSLENIYFVNPAPAHGETINTPRDASAQSSSCPSPNVEGNNSGNSHSLLTPKTISAGGSGAYPSSPKSPRDSCPLLSESYLSAITTIHGNTLRNLSLPARFKLSTSMIARLVRGCPNLEQLALSAEISSFDTLGLLLPFLRKLMAIRLLIPTNSNSTPSIPDNDKASTKTNKDVEVATSSNLQDCSPIINNCYSLAEIVDLDDSIHSEIMGIKLAEKDVSPSLRMVGLGWKVWEVGSFYTIPASEAKPFTFTFPNDYSGDNSAGESVGQSVANAAVPTPSISTQPAPALPPPPPPPSQQQQQQPQPQSSLGKRSRDSDTQVKKAPRNQRKAAADHHPTGTQPNVSTNVNGEGEKLLRRRRVRRVGWDVLKHWEIWAMDVQEI